MYMPRHSRCKVLARCDGDLAGIAGYTRSLHLYYYIFQLRKQYTKYSLMRCCEADSALRALRRLVFENFPAGHVEQFTESACEK